MDHFLLEFIAASIFMGLAIGLDAALATGVKTNALTRPRHAFFWLAGIS